MCLCFASHNDLITTEGSSLCLENKNKEREANKINMKDRMNAWKWLTLFPLFIQIGQFIWKLNSVRLGEGQLGIEVVVWSRQDHSFIWIEKKTKSRFESFNIVGCWWRWLERVDRCRPWMYQNSQLLIPHSGFYVLSDVWSWKHLYFWQHVSPDVDAEADVGEQAGVAVDFLNRVKSHLRPLNAVLLPVTRRD